jgi:DNA-directed RNA polymerase specialized sigma24 family protein
MSALVTCTYDAAVTYCYDPVEGAHLDPALRLTRMHEQFRDYIGRVIKGLARGRLSIRDLEDVYEDTLRVLLESLRQPGFVPRNPRAFFEAIARHKAHNALRRLGHQPSTNAEAVLNGIDTERTGTPLGRARHCDPVAAAPAPPPSRRSRRRSC